MKSDYNCLYFTDYIVITSFPLSLADNSFWWAPGWLQGANRSGQSTPCGRFALPTHCHSYSTCSLRLLCLSVVGSRWHIRKTISNHIAEGHTLHYSGRFSFSAVTLCVSPSHSLTFPIYIPVTSLSFSINFKSSSCQQNILVLSALLSSLPASEALLLYDFRPVVWMNHLLGTNLWIQV